MNDLSRNSKWITWVRKKFFMKLRKIVITAMVTMAMLTGVTAVTASAADGSLTISTSSATLTNTSGATRYANVNFIVIDRSTGSQVKSKGNSGNLANYASITASVSGYSSVNYRFKANGTLYKGTSPYSGVLWSGSKEY